MGKKTERLFGRFEVIYGGRFTACYGTTQAIELAIAEWAEVIERMNDEQLQRGIAWAKTSCPWPPSIAEFLHAGLGIDQAAIEREAMRHFSAWDRARMTYKQVEAAVKEKRDIAMKALIDDGLYPATQGLERL